MSDALTFNKNSVKIEISGTVDGKAKTYTLSNTEFAVKEKVQVQYRQMQMDS